MTEPQTEPHGDEPEPPVEQDETSDPAHAVPEEPPDEPDGQPDDDDDGADWTAEGGATQQGPATHLADPQDIT